MKHINKWILGAAAAVTLTVSFTSCTDDFDDTNRNPNQLDETQASSDLVFPGVVYRTMNVLQEINFRYVASLAQYNVHWFEQKDTEDYSKMLDMYKNGLNDLAKLERKYVGAEGYENVASMLLTYKSYIYYMLVTTWGNVPMSDATKVNIQQNYKYDTQEEIYNVILENLNNAVETFDVNGDKIKDPIFGGDVAKWRDFANTLRLQVALTIQNSDAELAKQHIAKAFEGENANLFIKEDAKFQFGTDLTNDASWLYGAYTQQFELGTNSGWGTYGAMGHNFYLYIASYNDPRLSKYTQPAVDFVTPTGVDARARLANDTIMQDSKDYPGLKEKWCVERYRIPYQARFDYREVPTGWIVGTDPNSPTGEKYRSAKDGLTAAINECFVNYDFMKRDAVMPIISLAELNFMKAEVAVKYPEVAVGGTAQQFYEAGVRASMASWGVSSADAEAYLNENGIKWNTDGDGLYEYRGFYKADIKGVNNPLEQIYKQWYIADFFNGFAGWTLERRTRVMNFPPHFYNGAVSTQGSNGVCDWMMERLIYPLNEHAANEKEWRNAVSELQRECPWIAKEEYRSANNGDNFYTLLRFAAPQPQSIDKWFDGDVYVNGEHMQQDGQGMIHYHSEFLRNPYGKTYEEICANVGKLFGVTISSKESDKKASTKILGELIDWKLADEFSKLYDPVAGRNLQLDRRGRPQYKDDGSYLYEGEEKN